MEVANHSATQPEVITAPQRQKISIAVPAYPHQIDTGAHVDIAVSITNASDHSISGDAPHQVFLAYHWVDAQGEYAQYDGRRTPLPEISPGNTAQVVSMAVSPPRQPGKYQLQIGLLQKQVSWFETDTPDHLQTLPITVVAGAQSTAGPARILPRYAQDRAIQLATPPAIFSFELTNQCPFKCIMCARTNNMTRAEGVMAFETFKKAVDEFVAVNPEHALTQEVWLHGFGESLVHPEFAKFMRYAVDKGINAGLSINPLMLTKKVAADLLDAGPKHLYVALDGHDDASFEKIRGVKNAYDKSRKRLLRFLEEKKRRGLDTHISLSMIDFPDNQGSIHQVAKFWEQCEGIDHFVAKPFVSWDGKAEDVNLLMGDEHKRPVTNDKVRCDFPWTKMTVSWDGELVPCCFDYNKRYSLGNVNNETLTEIWNGERMLALRSEFASNKVNNPLCSGCEYLYQEIVPEP